MTVSRSSPNQSRTRKSSSSVSCTYQKATGNCAGSAESNPAVGKVSDGKVDLQLNLLASGRWARNFESVNLKLDIESDCLIACNGIIKKTLHWWQIKFGSDKASCRQAQAITWIYFDPHKWRHFAPREDNELGQCWGRRWFYSKLN